MATVMLVFATVLVRMVGLGRPLADSSRKSATCLCGSLYETKLRQSRHAVVEADLLDDLALLKL